MKNWIKRRIEAWRRWKCSTQRRPTRAQLTNELARARQKCDEYEARALRNWEEAEASRQELRDYRKRNPDLSEILDERADGIPWTPADIKLAYRFFETDTGQRLAARLTYRIRQTLDATGYRTAPDKILELVYTAQGLRAAKDWIFAQAGAQQRPLSQIISPADGDTSAPHTAQADGGAPSDSAENHATASRAERIRDRLRP